MEPKIKRQLRDLVVPTKTEIINDNAYIKGRNRVHFIKELDACQCFIWLCCTLMCIMLVVQA
jgi:hypothetical protein